MKKRSNRRWWGAAAVPAAVVLLSLLDLSRQLLTNSYMNVDTDVRVVVFNVVTPWLLLAVLGPLPWMTARRVPLVPGGIRRAAAIHIAAAVGFAAVYVLVFAVMVALLRGTFDGYFELLPKSGGSFFTQVAVYAAIAGLSYGVSYYHEARDRAVAEADLRAALTEARLTALRGQLNPHFLFNTLNAISTMAIEGDQESVVRALGLLGELLRASLDDTLAQKVPLREELEFLERYLDLQRIRIGGRMSIVERIEPSVLDALVPSMLLQPFLENAITHGIARVPGPGKIELTASRVADSLHIVVSDTGPGFDHASVPGTGIGLANARARLAQLYGQGCSLNLGQSSAGGAMVSIAIPFETQ